MNQSTLLIAFIAVTACAVVLQTLILAGMYLSTRRLSQRMEALSTRGEEQVLPLVEKVRGLVDESAPMLRAVASNLQETSGLVRSQAGQINEALTEIVGVARTQAGRAGELATRTMQRVDHTAETLQHTVTSPMRHVSAILDGVMVGIGEFVSGRRGREARTAPNDERYR